jgi:hypothetical protein
MLIFETYGPPKKAHCVPSQKQNTALLTKKVKSRCIFHAFDIKRARQL